jgi:hypothetical protein
MNAYEKQQWDEAVRFVRAGIKRNPALAAALVKDMTTESAVIMLQQVGKELKTLQAVAQAFADTAGTLVKLENQPAKD